MNVTAQKPVQLQRKGGAAKQLRLVFCFRLQRNGVAESGRQASGQCAADQLSKKALSSGELAGSQLWTATALKVRGRDLRAHHVLSVLRLVGSGMVSRNQSVVDAVAAVFL